MRRVYVTKGPDGRISIGLTGEDGPDPMPSPGMPEWIKEIDISEEFAEMLDGLNSIEMLSVAGALDNIFQAGRKFPLN